MTFIWTQSFVFPVSIHTRPDSFKEKFPQIQFILVSLKTVEEALSFSTLDSANPPRPLQAHTQATQAPDDPHCSL